MATEIASGYISIYLETEKLNRGLAELKSQTAATMKANTSVTQIEANKQMRAQFQMWGNLMQRAVTVSRAIRRILMISFVPFAAAATAGFKAFSKASTAETMVAMEQFKKFKEVVKGRLGDAFYYAISSTKLFGKTTMEWLDTISEKFKNLTTQDVDKFITAMKTLAVSMAALKGFEMWLMLTRYISLAVAALYKYNILAAKIPKLNLAAGATGAIGGAVSAGAGAAASAGVSSLSKANAALTGAVALNTAASYRNTTALHINTLKKSALNVPMAMTPSRLPSRPDLFKTGTAGYALSTGSFASRFRAGRAIEKQVNTPEYLAAFNAKRMKVRSVYEVAPKTMKYNATEIGAKSILSHGADTTIAATGIARMLPLMGKFMLAIGKLSIIGTIIGVFVGAFAKLAGFKSLAEAVGSAFSYIVDKLSSLMSIITDTFDRLTTAVAEGMITIGQLISGVFKGSFMSKSGRKEWAKESQTAINEFRQQQKPDILPSLDKIKVPSPKIMEEIQGVMKDFFKAHGGYKRDKKELEGWQAGYHGEKMSSRDISDFVSKGQQEWTKSFLDNQKALYDLEAAKIERDDTYHAKMIELTKAQFVSLQQAAKEMMGVRGVLDEESGLEVSF